MKRFNPFEQKSPYKKVEVERRQRLIVAICNASILFSLLIIIINIALLLFYPSPLMSAASFLSFGILPVSLFSKRLAQRNHENFASYFFIIYVFSLITITALIVEDFFQIVIPGYILMILLSGMMLSPSHSFGIAAIASALYVLGEFVLLDRVPYAELPSNFAVVTLTLLTVSAFIFIAVTNRLATEDLREALDEATYDLVKTNQELEKASELKSQFTARTSHELRTPLSSIIAFTDLALRDVYGPLNEKLRMSLEFVHSSAQHLKAIINDLLDLSKIEAGELEIVYEPVEIITIVDAVENTCGELLCKKDIDFQVSISPDMPEWIQGDGGRLTQILMNLTSNAVKFTEVGEVEIRVEPINEHQWHMVVRDTGPGIAEDQFKDIFQAYRQLQNPYSASSVEGTGLGLAITRHLVEMMGGEVKVESELRRGSTFEVIFPLKIAEQIPVQAEVTVA